MGGFLSRKTEIPMTLKIGQKVYYPGAGPYLVSAVVRKVVCGADVNFYKFTSLDGSDAELLIPVGSSADLPLRALLAPDAIPRLLSRLKTRPEPPKEIGKWQERRSRSSKLFLSGSAFDLADAIESLTRSSTVRSLATDERETLRRARRLLICEIAAVMNESISQAESRIDSVIDEPPKAAKKPLNAFNFS
jgi:RNA polymerase-interacting CarD/CdnL/TRCF family regulator